MDEKFEALHESEAQIKQIVNIFSIIAVLIACLGLFGLSSFTTAQKAKEIGIRKVLGATVFDIIRLLSLRFLFPIVIALVFALPISTYLMDFWLEDFAYRIDIDLSIFILATVASLLIAWITMSYHSILAANANPVDTLKDE